MICNNVTVNEKGHLQFAGFDTVDLAAKYGTPLYLMDENKIREHIKEYKAAFLKYFPAGSNPEFASKSFSCKQIYRIMNEENMCIDAVSAGEIYTAKSAGFNMSHCFFHGNNKTQNEIELAIHCRVGHIVVDNKYELDLLNDIAKEQGIVQKILFRIKPGIDAHTHDFVKTGQIDSKFGVALENGEAFEIHKYATTLSNIQVDGVHCHIGSQIFEFEPFCEAAKVMMNFIADLEAKLSLKIKILNLGGGFGIKYDSTDDPLTPAEYIKKTAEAVKEVAMERNIDLPYLVFEPGRSIVAPAGITLYTVGGVKEIENVRTYVSIDGGMGDNPRYILYGAKYSAVVANNAGAKPIAPVTIAGKCCESGDLIQENIMMPEIKVGDTLAILATGAYNYSMASNYNRIPRPPIVAVKGNEKKVIVKRETYDDIIRNDVL